MNVLIIDTFLILLDILLHKVPMLARVYKIVSDRVYLLKIIATPEIMIQLPFRTNHEVCRNYHYIRL